MLKLSDLLPRFVISTIGRNLRARICHKISHSIRNDTAVFDFHLIGVCLIHRNYSLLHKLKDNYIQESLNLGDNLAQSAPLIKVFCFDLLTTLNLSNNHKSTTVTGYYCRRELAMIPGVAMVYNHFS